MKRVAWKRSNLNNKWFTFLKVFQSPLRFRVLLLHQLDFALSTLIIPWPNLFHLLWFHDSSSQRSFKNSPRKLFELYNRFMGYIFLFVLNIINPYRDIKASNKCKNKWKIKHWEIFSKLSAHWNLWLSKAILFKR